MADAKYTFVQIDTRLLILSRQKEALFHVRFKGEDYVKIKDEDDFWDDFRVFFDDLGMNSG